MVNTLHRKQARLAELLKSLAGDASRKVILETAEQLLKDMKDWDGDMVQRKSKAYDDVENFPNRFTANYMFLLNQTESDIPRVNQPSLDLKKEYDAQWDVLRQRGQSLLQQRIPALEKAMWEAGVGGLW
jgi:hypothetical protein